MWAGYFIFLGFCYLVSPQLLNAFEAPHLTFEGPDHLKPYVTRLEKMGSFNFRDTMQMVGLIHPGTPIRVILAEKGSEWARHAPAWASGYALSHRGLIVLLPERVLSYPYDSLENLLAHEVAHILIERAANGKPVPRWMDEGLAMRAAHTWEFEDQARLTWFMVTRDPLSVEELNALFHQDSASAKRAYVLSYALIRYFFKEFGTEWPRVVLANLAEGVPFETAFSLATFKSPGTAVKAFWASQTAWTTWVPVATSSAVLWLGIMALTFYVFKKQRQRAEALKRQWDHDSDHWK